MAGIGVWPRATTLTAQGCKYSSCKVASPERTFILNYWGGCVPDWWLRMALSVQKPPLIQQRLEIGVG